MRSIAFEYSRTDPQGALKWAVQNAGAQYAGDAVGMAMGMWARQDPEAASTYLNQLPVNPVRDAAVSSFAGMAVRDDPEGAIAWANTIADAATRTQTLADVARRWYRQDPEATTTWLANSGLSSEVQRSILQSPQPGSERGFRGRARGGFGPPPPDGGFGSRMGPP
jgi:hypothetical protein